MTLSSLIKKQTGEYVDFEETYPPNQCKDIVQIYIRDVLGLQRLPPGNAVDMWKRYQPDLYQRIPAKGNIPEEGDIVIWDRSVGSSGHIAIFIRTMGAAFLSFDQNWPKNTPCHEQRHDYKGVLGWLRRKGSWTDKIPLLFKEIWKRDGAAGEIAYFKRRIEKGSITNETELRSSLKKWYDIVYPAGMYSRIGDLRWQIEKRR